jgi:ubiquinone/menaquinone biosynthesis C-methylase UbiE
MSTVKERLGSQAQCPRGPLGWVSAGLMLVLGPTVCRHDAVAERLDLQPEDAVLDVACGSGVFLHRRAGHVVRVAGIDQSGPQVAMARQLLRRRIEVGSAEIVEGDAGRLPWPDDRFTAVSCNCLNCIDEAERAVAEMYRVLVPGGRLVIAADFHADTGAAGGRDRWGMRVWTEAELRGWLEAAGFTDVRLTHDRQSTFATARKPAGSAGLG